jgi:DNA topoisomerase II
LEVVGREAYGVLSVQGKLINAANPRTSVFGNKEVIRLCHALGLDTNKDYADGNISSLRYGHILIMTDQDPDGSHIKGLLINLLNQYWPRLLTIDGFCQQLITPLVKVTGTGIDLNATEKGKKVTLSFYSEQEYEDWRMNTLEAKGLQGLKNASVKYYKVNPFLFLCLSSSLSLPHLLNPPPPCAGSRYQHLSRGTRIFSESRAPCEELRIR